MNLDLVVYIAVALGGWLLIRFVKHDQARRAEEDRLMLRHADLCKHCKEKGEKK